jgi:hypothetical protein
MRKGFTPFLDNSGPRVASVLVVVLLRDGSSQFTIEQKYLLPYRKPLSSLLKKGRGKKNTDKPNCVKLLFSCDTQTKAD